MSLPEPRTNATVVVTGASAGIGTELARLLAARGHGVSLVARRRERLEELAGELRKAHGVDVDVHDCDLSDDAAREALIAAIHASGKPVAGLCNNAGYGSFGRFWELPREREAEMVKLNCVALVDLTNAFLAGMVGRGEGSILQLGSLAGYQPSPWNATYSATKAFVQSFTESVSGELRGTGVSMTVLCPGPVATEFGTEAGVEDLEAGLPGFLMQGAREVAEAGVEGMVRGKRVVFPGIPHRMIAQAGRVTPRTALLPIVNRIGKRTVGRTRT
ncbi:MAG TPA: SDR family oxidoreductase [Solirubrobacteraceae bacterium]|nr:SDR family oxidoreductase [Solirubrobacteraceae bacterium]